mmetsp:Transcript_2976/g.8977  ORF Transcript_2976/g.8977 Transcript_2976/m.8977 type:complete len:259 (+) Transcript_2976:1020-1796(+)
MMHRPMDGKFTSAILSISSKTTCSSDTSWAARTLAPPSSSGRRSSRTVLLKHATWSSTCSAPIIGIGMNDLSCSAKALMTSSRFSRRLGSFCSAQRALSSVSASYFRVVLLTTNTSFWGGSLRPLASFFTSDRAARVAAKFWRAASLNMPPDTKTTSQATTAAKTLTSVRMLAMALLPPSQSRMTMCMGSWPSWPLAAPRGGSPKVEASSESMGTTATSMPSVTGSALSLDSNASGKLSSRDARYDLPARPSPSKMTG